MTHPVKLVSVALLTCFCALLQPAMLHAQDGNGTISGTVLSPAGKPVAEARVYLQTSDGRKPKTEVTDQNGRFIFAMLPPTHYQVRAHHGDLWSDWQRFVRVKVGEQTNIKLQLKGKPTPKKK